MNVQQKKRKIFGKEFIFTVQDEELKTPVYRQIRGIINEPSWYLQISLYYKIFYKLFKFLSYVSISDKAFHKSNKIIL
jgi:hypothetical protein